MKTILNLLCLCIMEVKMNHKIHFDNDCELCRRSIRFVEKKDYGKKYNFVPLNLNKADTLELSGYNQSPPDTVILEANGQKYKKSTAVLRIFRGMGFPWNLLYMFIIVPGFIRDRIYDFVAKNRKMLI